MAFKRKGVESLAMEVFERRKQADKVDRKFVPTETGYVTDQEIALAEARREIEKERAKVA